MSNEGVIKTILKMHLEIGNGESKIRKSEIRNLDFENLPEGN